MEGTVGKRTVALCLMQCCRCNSALHIFTCQKRVRVQEGGCVELLMAVGSSSGAPGGTCPWVGGWAAL